LLRLVLTMRLGARRQGSAAAVAHAAATTTTTAQKREIDIEIDRAQQIHGLLLLLLLLIVVAAAETTIERVQRRHVRLVAVVGAMRSLGRSIIVAVADTTAIGAVHG
jgi:hypothetical protein